MLGNKGAVAANFWLEGQYYTFIDVHLCSGEDAEAEKQRREDIERILATVFVSSYQERLQYKCSSKVVLLGDLNTRLKMTAD
jgi:hypothetical protein